MSSWLSSLVRGNREVEEAPKMKIWVATLTGEKIELNVSKDDTVETVMGKVQDSEGFAVSSQRMIYSGKQIEKNRTLSSYEIKEGATIHLLLRSDNNDSQKRSSYETRATFQIDNELPNIGMMQFTDSWTARVQGTLPQSPRGVDRNSEQGFDDDESLLSPERYYEKLGNLEKMVVESSEYYLVAGRHDPTVSNIANADAMYASSHCSLDVWRCFDRCFSGKPSLDPAAAMSLGKSYLILSRVLDTLESLTQKLFCSDAFTVLISRPSPHETIAEMVMVERTAIADLHDAVGDTILAIFRGGQPLPEDVTSKRMSEILTPALTAFTVLIGIELPEQLSHFMDLLHFCRILTLILDLGLVSFMGCHGTRFDLDYLGLDQSELLVKTDSNSELGFRLSLQRLACLERFLNGKHVWTFQPLWMMLVGPQRSDSSLSILTTISAFADTWGPLWTIPAGEDFPDHFKQLNVGTGLICRVGSRADSPVEEAVPCHWFDSRAPITPPSSDESSSMFIHRSQKILIAGLSLPVLGTNKTCSYGLDDLERDYGLHMTPLGTNASSWVYDERQVGFSASQYIGITVLGTQKKLPCITQKQAIWNKWTNQPTRANPRILNSYLGVEISHCTGNARRVKLRDIYTMKPVQALLARQFPDWKNTDFGPSLQLALSSASDTTIEEVWVKHYKSRNKVGEMVCCVLEMLEKTGMSNAGFNAAFLNQQRELSMPIQPRLNRWAEFLQDSHLTAVYAIINDNCLAINNFGETGHHISACDPIVGKQSDGFTAFETQIAVPQTAVPQTFDSRDKIWLNQRGFLQLLGGTQNSIRMVTWEAGKARELGGKLGRLLRSKETPNLSREVQDSNELGGQHVQVLVKSTVPSYGGLPSKRIANIVQRKREGIDHFQNSLEIGMPMEESVVMLEVGARRQAAGSI